MNTITTTRTTTTRTRNPATATPVQNLNALLNRLARDYDRRLLAKCRERGYRRIRLSHFTLFNHLGLGSARLTDLAERAKITQQAMGKVVKEMEQAGYVEREEDPNDKRAKNIRLTPLGQKLFQDSIAVIEEISEEYDQLIGAQQISALASTLADSLAALHQGEQPELQQPLQPMSAC